MARKPTYQFERAERDRQKAAKVAAKRQERERAAAARVEPSPDDTPPADD
jgi:hypothetical protein